MPLPISYIRPRLRSSRSIFDQSIFRSPPRAAVCPSEKLCVVNVIRVRSQGMITNIRARVLYHTAATHPIASHDKLTNENKHRPISQNERESWNSNWISLIQRKNPATIRATIANGRHRKHGKRVLGAPMLQHCKTKTKTGAPLFFKMARNKRLSKENSADRHW